MTRLVNTFEGGTDGVAITNANSGGSSRDALTSVFGATPVFTNVQKRRSMAYRLVDASAATGIRWTGLAGGTNDMWCRTYLYLTAYPTTNPAFILYGQTAANTLAGLVSVETGGHLRSRNFGGAAVGTEGAVLISLNQWVRVEMRLRPGASPTGQIEWRLYNTADSLTISETQNNTGIDCGADIDGFRVGLSGTPPTTPFTAYFDDIGIDTTGWMGPEPGGFTNSVIPTVTGALTVGGTLTANPGTWLPTPSSYQYYWQRMDDAAGTNMVNIGATGSTYTLDSADLNKYLRAGVIPVP